MKVKKRDGSIEDFNFDKIKNAIYAAAESCDKSSKSCNECVGELRYFFSMFEETMVMSVEEIQDIVERNLMDLAPYDVAKAYIIYREKHKQVREWTSRKKEFIENYKKSSNTADATVDDNSNVSGKNIGILNSEIHKEDNIKISRRMIEDKLRELYPKFDAKQYSRDLTNHIIYKHDESGFAGAISPYCCSITMYPFLMKGIKDIGGLSAAPKNLDSFCGMYINLIFATSAQFAGACMHKSQKLLVRINGIVYKTTAKDLIDKFFSENTRYSFSNYQGTWEYVKTEQSNLEVLEDGKFIKVNKLYRREYQDKIYRVSTRDGYTATVTKDHMFKSLFNSRELTIKSEELKEKDTVFMNKDYSCILNPDSKDYKTGWCIGILCGDGSLTEENTIKLSVNYNQEYLGDTFNKFSEEVFGYTLHKNNGHRCWNYTKRNTEFKAVISQFITGSNTYDKHIDVSDKSVDFLLGFLDGLLCADGSYTQSRGIHVSLTNRQLSENIRYIVEEILDIKYSGYHSIPTRGNRKESFSQYIPSRILKYLYLTPKKKRIVDTCKNLSDESREVYHYGYNATTSRSSNYFKLISDGKLNVPSTKLEVISHIETFNNDDNYVYELETETHWYNCGGFITHNCATSEFLLYFDYFARKEWGDNYHLKSDVQLNTAHSLRYKDIKSQIHQYFQQVVYSINQPAAARGLQSAFVNFSLFDKCFFEGMFGSFAFPDGSKPNWESFNWLQKEFLHWFNQERLKCILTFPVVSCTLLYKDNKFQDEDFYEFICEEYSQGNSFFLYISDTVDSLSSCCRLKNKIQTKEFNFTNGNMGIMTGSKSVISLNINRIVQNFFGSKPEYKWQGYVNGFRDYLNTVLDRVYKYQTAYNELLWDMYNANLLPVYKAGFIDLNKQYLTIGIIGFTAAAEFLGINITDNEEYADFCQYIFGSIKAQNEAHKSKKTTWNTELVPAESAGLKLYNADKKDGYWVPEDINLYTSYIFKPYDSSISVLDKIKMHGNQYIGDYLDGGSSCHINLDSHLSKEQYKKLLLYAAENGCSYLTFNVPNAECEDCGFITKVPITECPKCGSKHIALWDRIIGYLTKIKNWSAGRQIEQKTRVYSKL